MPNSAGTPGRLLSRAPGVAVPTVGAVALVVAGLALRVYVLTTRLGYLDSDEAVTGIFGTSMAALRAVPLALFGIAALLVWHVGRRTIGEREAIVAGCLAWVFPSYFVWKSTRADDFYGALLVCGLCLLLLALRLYKRPRRRDALLFGLAVGLGLWASPAVALVAVPATAWLAWTRPRLVREAWLALVGATVGAAPWLVDNARHGWHSTDLGAPVPSTFGGRLDGFFEWTLPATLGVRAPYSGQWLLDRAVGFAAVVAFALAVLWLLRRRRSEPALLAPSRSLLLWPVAALVVARACAQTASAAAVLAAAVALSAAGLVSMSRTREFLPLAPDVHAPARSTRSSPPSAAPA